MKWSAISSSAPCPATTETSAKQPRRWDSAAARCIAGCKNTAWNETPHLRTSHPASGAGGGITRIVDRIDSPLEWLVFVADRLDADIFYSDSLVRLRALLAASCGLLAANFIESALRNARTGLFLSRARSTLR